jgi:hypothetical protein
MGQVAKDPVLVVGVVKAELWGPVNLHLKPLTPEGKFVKLNETRTLFAATSAALA